ncbi:MAG TPA: polysaccharide deacetylase family protein [Stellaceae bacterium]|nr:polysaccharide deacetylase family protein [Stellaceae bacterium]
MLRRTALASLAAFAFLGSRSARADENATENPTVALTFDDGPHPELTPRLLDILEREQISATFFVIGSCAAHRPDIVRRAFDAGHEIGNHTWSHPVLTRVSLAQAAEEISRTDALLKDLTGSIPNTLRPPYGAMNNNLSELTLPRPLMLWDVDTLDWKTRNTLAVERAATESDGGIVLFHDIHPTTVEAIPAIIRNFKSRGYHFVTISSYVTWEVTDPSWLDRA